MRRNSILDEFISPAWRSFWQYVFTHGRQVLTVIVVLPLMLLRHAPEIWERVRAHALKVVLDYSVRNRK